MKPSGKDFCKALEVILKRCGQKFCKALKLIVRISGKGICKALELVLKRGDLPSLGIDCEIFLQGILGFRV